MWEKVGPLREAEGLKQALEGIESIREEARDLRIADFSRCNQEITDAIELPHMLAAAEAIAVSALERRESRGAHVRADFPDHDTEKPVQNILVEMSERRVQDTVHGGRRMSIHISIKRYDPDKGGEPVWVDYEVPAHERTTVLEALMNIYENQDPTLAFRFGCRFDKCGLCAVEVNGKPRMACYTDVKEGMKIGPLAGMPVVRDLVIDRTAFFEALRELELYIPEQGERSEPQVCSKARRTRSSSPAWNAWHATPPVRATTSRRTRSSVRTCS